MNNVSLNRQLQRVRQLFGKTASLTGDIEMQSHWAQYLCVIVAGFLENALSEIFINYVSGKTNDKVTRFTRSHLDRLSNPKTRKFVETARSFDPNWADILSNFVEDEGRKEAIDAIMENRHRIAHGQSSTITISRLNGYFTKALEVVEFVEVTCV